MKLNRTMATLLTAAGLMGLGTAAQAVPAVVAQSDGIVIQVAPPAPRYEVRPADREGYVWVPGHYDWRDGRYVWLSGQWMADRPGFEWREARWVQRSDGSWHLINGGWIRDRADRGDRDRYAYYDNDDDRGWNDRRWNSRRFGPDGDMDRDGVANRDDRDRDGDGVLNRFDEFPNNPNRS